MALGATSGTYGFSPSAAALVMEAFDRIRKPPTEVTRHQAQSARISLQYELINWVNDGAPLWEIESGSITVVPGQATYPMPANLVTMTDIWWSRIDGNGPGDDSDRIISPMDRSDYAALPNKNQRGDPTLYWFQMIEPAPQITFWQVPTVGDPIYAIRWFGLRQPQDVYLAGGASLDVAYRGLDALCGRLSLRLLTKFGPSDPNQYQLLKSDLTDQATLAWQLFQKRDQEDGPMTMGLDVSGYARGFR